jgi:hypothetical protein
MANKNLEFAGDYDLQYVYISNHKGQGRTHSLRGENITHMIVELNIYEGIYKSSITGSMVIADIKPYRQSANSRHRENIL